MAIKFSCGSCGKKLTVKDEHAGRRSKCPSCGWGIVVPFQATLETDDSSTVVPPPLAKPDSLEPMPENSGRPSHLSWPFRTGLLVVAVAALASIGVFGFILRSTKPPFAARTEGGEASVTTPGTPGYEIIERDGDSAKDVFTIRLARKPSKDELLAIAREVRSQARRPRAVMWFRLRDGNPNSWASADCDPELRLEILGLTAEEEAALVARPLPAGEVIGRWVEDSLEKALYTIYRGADSLFLETVHDANSPSKGLQQELVEVKRTGLRQFQRREYSRAGDHYVINSYGDLELRDDHGLIAVARRVR
jgi:DNA-directed RNA polymerase subunit RPC12/RpoP